MQNKLITSSLILTISLTLSPLFILSAKAQPVFLEDEVKLVKLAQELLHHLVFHIPELFSVFHKDLHDVEYNIKDSNGHVIYVVHVNCQNQAIETLTTNKYNHKLFTAIERSNYSQKYKQELYKQIIKNACTKKA